MTYWHIGVTYLTWHTDILTYNVLTYSKLENVSIDWQTDLMFWHIEILTYWNIDILTYWHVAEIKIYFLKRPWKSSMDLIIIFFSNNITFDFSGHWRVLKFRVLKFFKLLVTFDASLLMNVFRSCYTCNRLNFGSMLFFFRFSVLL